MPASRLSRSELARLSGLEPEQCDDVIAALEDAAFLSRAHGGLFVLNLKSPLASHPPAV